MESGSDEPVATRSRRTVANEPLGAAVPSLMLTPKLPGLERRRRRSHRTRARAQAACHRTCSCMSALSRRRKVASRVRVSARRETGGERRSRPRSPLWEGGGAAMAGERHTSWTRSSIRAALPTDMHCRPERAADGTALPTDTQTRPAGCREVVPGARGSCKRPYVVICFSSVTSTMDEHHRSRGV